MKTGSMINHLMLNQSTHEQPEVGMGATVCMWSDRVACTIIEVKHFKSGQRKGQVSEITIQRDKVIRTDSNGMSDAQSYRYERDPEGAISTFKVHKDGGFGYVKVGFRDHYYDFSF